MEKLNKPLVPLVDLLYVAENELLFADHVLRHRNFISFDALHVFLKFKQYHNNYKAINNKSNKSKCYLDENGQIIHVIFFRVKQLFNGISKFRTTTKRGVLIKLCSKLKQNKIGWAPLQMNETR